MWIRIRREFLNDVYWYPFQWVGVRHGGAGHSVVNLPRSWFSRLGQSVVMGFMSAKSTSPATGNDSIIIFELRRKLDFHAASVLLRHRWNKHKMLHGSVVSILSDKAGVTSEMKQSSYSKKCGPDMSAHDVMILAAHSLTVVRQCMPSSGTCNDTSHRHYTVMQPLSASKTVHWTVKIAPTMHQKSLLGDQKSEKNFWCPLPRKFPQTGERDTPPHTPAPSAPAAPRLGSRLRRSASPKPSHFTQTSDE